ncbi:MAG: transcriptional regulator [Clostridia bacterium]|nr:transcriptional regulator [Clostridia bacterium]
MKSELTGMRFGKLFVVEPTSERKHGAVIWRCRCDCGKVILIETRKLKSGVMQSCGCCEQKRSMADLVGQRFGRLVVVEKTEKRSKNRYVIWRCQCDCGNIVETTRNKLLSGNTTSCGCAKTPPLKDWIGKRFGRLEVLTYVGKDRGCHMWRCRCDCGKVIETRQSNLQSGCTTSCGCKRSPPDILHFVDGTCVELIQSKNISKANTSGIRGVYFDKRRKKWIAQIMFKGKCYYLGGYNKIENAVKARQRGEEMFSDFLEEYRSGISAGIKQKDD